MTNNSCRTSSGNLNLRILGIFVSKSFFWISSCVMFFFCLLEASVASSGDSSSNLSWFPTSTLFAVCCIITRTLDLEVGKYECLKSNFSLTLVNYTTFLYQLAISTVMLHNKHSQMQWLFANFYPHVHGPTCWCHGAGQPWAWWAALFQAVGQLGLALGFKINSGLLLSLVQGSRLKRQQPHKGSSFNSRPQCIRERQTAQARQRLVLIPHLPTFHWTERVPMWWSCLGVVVCIVDNHPNCQTAQSHL